VCKLVIAVRTEYEHPHVLFCRVEVAKQEQASAVGPLEILEYEDNGLML
jgi:hypothetical protein